MKSIIKILSAASIATTVLFSCEKIDGIDEENDPTDNTSGTVTRNVKLVAKTSNFDNVTYPIKIYAFDKNGNVAATTSITEVGSTSSQFSLKKGQYHITALSIPDSYSITTEVTGRDDEVGMPDDGYASVPLMTGSADITVSSSDQTANISLGYRQASIRVTVGGVPSDVTGVSVSLSSVYTDMNLDGDMSGETAVTVPCEKVTTSDNSYAWSTGKVYVYPSINAHPSITITMKGGTAGTTSYSHTYNSSLLSGTPYSFAANYNGGGTIGGEGDEDMNVITEITTGEWADEITESFSFGSEGSGETETNTADVIYVSSIPGDGDIWNGHVIAAIDEDENNPNVYNAVLISLEGWSNVPSKYNETNPTKAAAIAEEYEENGLSGWSIPSREDAIMLYNLYSYESNNTILNSNITSCGGTGVIVTNGSSPARYLCEDGEKTFSFKSSTITQAGAKTMYYLRLTKRIKFVLK